MESLMELIEDCGKAANEAYHKERENLNRASELEALGFKHLAKEIFDKVERAVRLARISEFEYIKISEKKIREYLKKKVARYNESHPGESRVPGSMIGYTHVATGMVSFLSEPVTEQKSKTITFSEMTNDYYSTKDGTIGQFVWTETPIEEYSAIPPAGALKTLEVHQARNIFDQFTIASVNEVKDPLLFGRLEGLSDRFFLCQWGEDIQLDDVI